MKYYIGEDKGTGRKFDDIQDFLDALADIAQTREENGEEWFEVKIIDG